MSIDKDLLDQLMEGRSPGDLFGKAVAPSWRRAWIEVIPFLDYPPEVRRLIYTTNAIEARSDALSLWADYAADLVAGKPVWRIVALRAQQPNKALRPGPGGRIETFGAGRQRLVW